MQKKEIVLTLGFLAEKDACDRGIEEFKKWYPSGSAPLSEVLRKLQKLANTSTKYLKYVDYARWLILRFPPTQEPLVLNKLTGKFLFWNGDINIKSGIDGERFIIGNGNVNIKGNGNLNGRTRIWARKEVKAINIAAKVYAEILAGTIDAQNITAYDHSGIDAKTIDAENIAAKDFAGIFAGTIDAEKIAAKDFAGIFAGTIDAEKIAAKDFAVIRAWETMDAVNIAAYDHSGIGADEINTQNIIDDSYDGIHGKINLIRPSSNQQNTTTAS